MLGGLGLRVVDVASGRILAETYANRSVRPIVAPDGSAVYTITPKSDTEAWPYILSRHDPLTLQVTAQREVDDGAALYFLVPPALGAAGCQPASPSEPWGSPAGAPEVRGTARKGQLWALVFHSLPIVAKQQVKIVWRMSGQGALHIFAEQGKGARLAPDWGPQQHGGSNWNRPGDEWGTGFTFPQPGCWRVHASRSHIAGDVWFQVAR
jgi:hypothetical protein